MIPYGRQAISEEDIAAVCRVLQSEWLTQGPAVQHFETAVATYCGAKHAVALNNATSALHVACLALGLSPGDLLWTVPNTFVASANCARFCGADVDFVDIDVATGNISIEALRAKLAEAERRGLLPKILVPVAFAGLPCDLSEIRDLARHYGFYVIEDASHAIGATYRGSPVGCGEWADITVFSFHPVKIITTGEGGMAMTNDPVLARRMARLRSHGITRQAEEMEQLPEGGWYYEMSELGWNYRMTDIQAALGTSQLSRLDEFVARRHALAARYHSRLAGCGLRLPAITCSDRTSAFHLYVIGWNESISGRSRAEAYAALHQAGIQVNVHYIPVHCQPYYRRFGFRPGQFPQAEMHYRNALSLPLFPDLTETDQDKVIDKVLSLLR